MAPSLRSPVCRLGLYSSGLEVEAGTALFQTLGGYSMNIPFSQDDVIVAADLDLVTVLGIKQDLVPNLHGPYVRSGGYHLCPTQTLTHLGGSRYQDSAGGPPLTILCVGADQNSVVQHLDRETLVVRGSGDRVAVQRGRVRPVVHQRNGIGRGSMTGRIAQAPGGRTATPAADKCSLAFATLYSPK